MSFILIGFGRRTYKDFGETGNVQRCIRCGNEITYRLTKVRSWITFFFVPIFSYRGEYRVECPICHYGIRLQAAEVKAAKQGTLKVYVSND